VRQAVTLGALMLALAQILPGQFARRAKVSKGPRALGLLELPADGKAHLIPITIMVDGRFYDAGDYKASPVPLALEPGTVYEGERTGASQGLFTITGVQQSKDAWMAVGNWQVAGSAPPKTAHRADEKPIMGDENEGPPKLRRTPEKPSTESAPPANKPQETAPSQAPTPPPGQTPTAPATPTPPAASTPATTPENSAPNSTTDASEESGDHPVLRRGKPSKETQAEVIPSPSTPTAKPSKGSAASAPAPGGSSSTKNAVQLIPAISDADGPDPQPYTYPMKPDEEQKFRNKMLALAADAVRARARLVGGAVEAMPPLHPATGSRKTAAVKPPPPTFDNVELRVFDLSNSNEPTLVLTATAHMPVHGTAQKPEPQPDYFLTLVARSDIYGELHKLSSNVTDTQHLDVIPRMEVIDAVDADGDGRGELLFRQTSDSGRSFAIYRVTPDRLWPLFGGSPE
jgi:hypothetical protein